MGDWAWVALVVAQIACSVVAAYYAWDAHKHARKSREAVARAQAALARLEKEGAEVQWL